MYQIVISEDAQHDGRKIPVRIRGNIFDEIENLVYNPQPHNVKKLKGRFKKDDYYRIRIGPYRVMYRIDDEFQIVYVDAIRLRADVYRKH